MSVYDPVFDMIIDKALNILFDKKADIFTFALYYDHKSHAVSVCADTSENSERVTREMNNYTRENFFAAIQQQDLEMAALWNCVTGRNFALGNFKYGSLGWKSIKAPNNSAPFYRAMAQSLMRNSNNISALTRSPENLVLCCSSKNSEVGLSWFHEGS